MLDPSDRIEGLAKGLAVLESFSPERAQLSTSQVAARTGLSRAAARRQLLTLCELGYLDARDGQYGLSPRVLRLAGAYLASARLPRLAQPVLDRLALLTREACSLVVLDRAEVVIVARSLGALPSRWQSGEPSARSGVRLPATPLMAYGLHQGARLAAHATSTGRVLLAGLQPAELSAWLAEHAPLRRLTAHTVTEPRALRALLRDVRRQDHCVAHEGHELGVHAVAVPVRDLGGRCVAALNIVGSPDRLQGPSLVELLAPLHAASRELQAVL